jgi:hypothetical protein
MPAASKLNSSAGRSSNVVSGVAAEPYDAATLCVSGSATSCSSTALVVATGTLVWATCAPSSASSAYTTVPVGVDMTTTLT